MNDVVGALVFDFLEYVNREQRSYADVMEVWRTSCPRLAVWEEALEAGFIRRANVNGISIVTITDAGRSYLQCRHPPASLSS